MPLSRRQVLIGTGSVLLAGAGGVGLVEAGVLPGRSRLDALLGRDGGDLPIPDVEPGPSESGTFRSAARGRLVGWSILRPPGAPSALPVAVVLHGRGGDHTSAVALGYDRFLAAAVAAGTPPFAVLTVDGGDTYWHRRASGDDPIAMIRDELLPLAARRGLRIDRIAVQGWSMGGYGALLLAERWGATRARAAGAMSPAIFADFASSSSVAFDNAADFAANDLFRGIAGLAGISVRIDCGTDDPFADQVTRFRAALHPTPAGSMSAGAHTDAFWHRMLPGQLDFVGRALAG